MDFQELSELSIADGDVRTIHDAEGNLLWGKLYYDTKYQGDAEQQTYSGKNLFNGILESGIINGNTGQNAPNAIYVRAKDYIPVQALTNYTISSTNSEIENFNIYEYKSDYTYNLTNNIVVPKGGYWQTKADTSYIRFRPAYQSSDTSMKFQVEKGTTPTAYEPYVGGIPAPNPDYPQPINVVTGTQTVTLSDGTNSESYSVRLGSLELAKIGTYQDYIYKSGDDWYVHKETTKILFDGTQTWGGINGKFSYVDSSIAAQPLGLDEPIICYSNYLLGSNYSSVVNDLGDNIIAGYYNGGQFRTRTTNWSTHTDFETWLTTHNMTVYYALATSTDTQITDTNLISDLNAIHQFLTRYGYSSSVSGNLPMIINQTALS